MDLVTTPAPRPGAPVPPAVAAGWPVVADTHVTSAGGLFSAHVVVKMSRDPGTVDTLHDDAAVPGNKGIFASYTWNQAITAMLGGCGGANGFYDKNNRYIPPPGHYSQPGSLQTAHLAMDSIAAMFQDYAKRVAVQAAVIAGKNGGWQGPAADAFTKTVTSFVKYLNDLAGKITDCTRADENLHTLADRLDLAWRVADVIWAATTKGDGHDRTATVALSGAFTFPNAQYPTDTMANAACSMLNDLDLAYIKVVGSSAPPSAAKP